jgi:hypothetical protein
VIRIAITQAAFEAIAATLPSGNVLYERERTPHGGYFVWLERAAVNNLERLRGPRDEDTSAPSSSDCSASMRPTSRSSNSWTSSTGNKRSARCH